jgi:hypothetical protein
MSSLVPLNNAYAQNTVNFNSQTPSNAGGLFRYKVNTYAGASHTFDVSDLNAVCVFEKDTTLLISTANFSSTPPVGTEILFYSAAGYVKLTTSGASLYSSDGVYTLGPNWLGKIIYKGGNIWFFASANFDAYAYNWTDSCEHATAVYQIKDASDSNVYVSTQRSYTDNTATIPYNGVVYSSDESLYFSIANGYAVGSSGAENTNNYTTTYTLYTGPDAIGDAVSLYSVNGLSTSVISSLAGAKFFTSNVGSQYACYSTNTVSPGATADFYSATAYYPTYPIIFKDGYVINIDDYL